MSILSRSELNRRSARGISETLASLDESQSRKEATLKRAGRIPSLFLSHSHQDKDLVLPVALTLKNLGVEIYVDWMDGEMPPSVSGATATKLKLKIKEHDKFVVLVTESSKDSHWVPWELGIADGTKGMQKIASFPVRKDDTNFVGNEYFSIYPRIEEYQGDLIVWTSDPPTLRRLRDWLASP